MRYNGGKNGGGLYQWIINHIPPHTRYIDLFAGSAAILRYKRPARSSIAVDIDARSTGYLEDLNLPGTTTITTDAISWLASYRPQQGDFLYLDPPYPRMTRRSKGKLYIHELTDHDHTVLLKRLVTLNVPAAISSSPNDIYTHLLSTWHAHCYETFDRQHRPRTEILWTNYKDPLALHDYAYLGTNFRDRERIKRKYLRWKHRLQQLAPLERAMLQTLLTADSTPT